MVTDKQTALGILSDPSLVEQDSIKATINQSNPEIAGYFYRHSSGGSGSLSIYDETVFRIDIKPSPPALLFDELISIFGTPEYVQIDSLTNEGSCYNVNLFYPTIGLWVRGGGCQTDEGFSLRIGGKEPNTAKVHPNIPTSNLILTNPSDSLESMLANSLLFDEESVSYIIDNREIWMGFGFYPVSSN